MPEPDPDAFERMARELGCDETGEAFDRALAKVLPPRRARSSTEVLDAVPKTGENGIVRRRKP
jgi:hypothetical protein